MKRAVFWADSGPGVGFGHLTRCCSVAQELQKSGTEVCVFTPDPRGVAYAQSLGALAVAYRFWVHPQLSSRLRSATGSSSQYRHDVVVAADSFSGYCILRSDLLRDELKTRQIRLTVKDDKADYAGRLRALRKGDELQDFYSVVRDMHEALRGRVDKDIGIMASAIGALEAVEPKSPAMQEALDALKKLRLEKEQSLNPK